MAQHTIAFQKILILAALTCFISACNEEQNHSPIVKSVIAIEPQAAHQQVKRTLSGVLRPVDQSILSFEIPGVVQDVNVNLGDRFEAGDVLASIDDKVFRLALQQREGQLSEAKARLTEAKLDFERNATLVQSGAVSQAQVDVAKARYESLIDQVNIAQTQVALAREDLDDTRLRAPFPGSVAVRHIEPSQQISPTTAILTIQGSDALEVSVLVPESMINDIQAEDEVLVDVLIDRSRETIKGKVFERGKQAQQANAFPVTISLQELPSTSSLQAGMSAEVVFSLSKHQYFASNEMYSAPLSSVAAGAQDTHYIYVLKPSPSDTQSGNDNSYTLQKASVEVHAFHSDSVVFSAEYASNTVNVGSSKIVASGLDFLRDGQQVRVMTGHPRTINE
ncbi:efflux RND transporter periplasmic adaptor subunit [Ningiella sp. W23]|uniref:efflux RND transporter periplasmic adaptor subunit n=1 Tax=Ningiella sp. W23 TaxID=3023715 RepID=UPI0037568900